MCFDFFRDISTLKWPLNNSNRIQNGHKYPVGSLGLWVFGSLGLWVFGLHLKAWMLADSTCRIGHFGGVGEGELEVVRVSDLLQPSKTQDSDNTRIYRLVGPNPFGDPPAPKFVRCGVSSTPWIPKYTH